jgi:hypothetical protein
MAEKEVSKTQAIRDYLNLHPEATASVIIPALAEEGIEVSQGLVNNTRSKFKHQGKSRSHRSAAAKRTPKGANRAPLGRSGSLTAEDLFEAKKLADLLGGLNQARKAIDALEQLRLM